MGSQTKSELVRAIAGSLISGIEALQNVGITERQWRRLATDTMFRNNLGEVVRELDISTTGPASKITFQPGDCREVVWEKLVKNLRSFDILKKELIMILSEDGRKPKFLPPPEPVQREVELFDIFVGYWMSLKEAEDELKSRQLKSASVEEAMLYFLHYYACIPDEHSIFVLDGRTHYASQIRRETKLEILYLCRTLDGRPGLYIDDVDNGISGGSYLLAKRA